MQAHRYSARHGLGWLVRGFQLWRQAALPLTASAMTMGLGLMVVGQLPGLFGPLAMAFLLPVFSVGMFMCCDTAAKRRPMLPGLLFRNFPDHAVRLCGLAVLQLAGVYLFLWISGTDPGQMLKSATTATGGVVSTQDLLLLGLAMLVRLPVDMACWFAAPLIALQRISLGKALFFSFMASWRNLGALLAFMFAFLMVGVVSSTVLEIFARLIPTFLLFILFLMIMVPVYFASFYTSARDIFGEWPDA
jgi:hypothetical protein